MTNLEAGVLTKAAEEVEKIIKLQDNADIKKELQEAGNNITSKEDKRFFYRHMNTLFLNVLLNRLDELGESAEQRSLEARKEIVNIIYAL